jgi:hypothetical protein
MINRHRVPTVFSIYMLDVICCALGCVILLWQLKHNEAEEQTEAARLAEQRWMQASTEVLSGNAEIDALRMALAESRTQYQRLMDENLLVEQQRLRTEKERDEAKRLVLLTQSDYEKMRQAYLFSEAMLKTANLDREKLEKEKKLALLDLADKVNKNAELLLQITAADKKVRIAAKEAAVRKLDAEEAAKRLAEQLAQLRAVELKNTQLENQAAELRVAMKVGEAKLTVQELRAKMLEQDLERSKKELAASAGDAATAIASLQKDRAVLTERVKTMQAEADERFAGIALTGANVLFLVDMSGSMAMRDEKTADPDKWPLVCETVAQLMRSIKSLQFFQVILFSDQVRYPLGSPATWLKFDPKESPRKTLAALKAIEPEGETNMHAVFGEAFRYREAKLDTLYILSDGLPNAGNGISPSRSEPERTAILSKHLRGKLKNDWNRPIIGQPRVRINSIGFFFESPDVGAFLWALSREHDGSFVGMSK